MFAARIGQSVRSAMFSSWLDKPGQWKFGFPVEAEPEKNGVDSQRVTTIHQSILLPNRLVSADL